MSDSLSMTANSWLRYATEKLTTAGITTARLDSLVLLEDACGQDRGWLLAYPEYTLTSDQIIILNTKIVQRSNHLPLAYIRGTTEFYGRNFVVTPAVLEPRPESETMIDLLLHLPVVQTPNVHIADVGAGSGALGITAKIELPKATVDLLEIDNEAIEVSKKNVINFATGVAVIHSNLLQAAPRNYEVLLCNLPYVPDDFHINLAATAEPKLAIFGGPDGLSIYRQLFKQVAALAEKPLFILCESMPPQHNRLTEIALTAGFVLQTTSDFIQVFGRQKVTP